MVMQRFNKTPCENLGYKIGDRFEVIGGDDRVFSIGSLIELIRDDGSSAPLFKLIQGICHYGDDAYMDVSYIRKMENKGNIQIPCPEGYEFDGIRPVQAGESYLNLQDFKCVAIASDLTRFLGNMIALKKKQPDTLAFEFERVDGLEIDNGLYFTNEVTKIPFEWKGGKAKLDSGSNTVIWRLISDNHR